MRYIFKFFKIYVNRSAQGPLQNCCSLFDFEFKLAEIFVIENRHFAINDAGSR
jgi:hypothetical protein